MESDLTPRAADAALALQKAANARAAVALRARAPIWYHPALGLLTAGIPISLTVSPLAEGVCGLVFALGVLFLVRAHRKHTGMWIPGYRAGRTRTVAIGMAVITVLVMLASLYLTDERGVRWAAAAGAAIVSAVVTAAGFLWEAAYAADLAGDLSQGGRP